jgi:hypothetical protein
MSFISILDQMVGLIPELELFFSHRGKLRELVHADGNIFLPADF